MQIPNGLGALFGLAQLVLYACYCSSTPKTDDGKNVEMPTVVNTVGGGNVSVTVER
jgi:solute carrier family 50 protein (sugar transporter)